MAMKKKFLGLALATMVALPATTAYAAGTTQDTQTIVSESNNVQVAVTGSVTTKKGQKPEKVEVVLPSKLAFTVNQDGDFDAADFDIVNNSTNVDIDVAVSNFSGGRTLTDGSGDGIQVLSKEKFDAQGNTELYRNQIRLSLSKIGSTDTVDLGNYKSLTAVEKKLGTINSGQTAKLTLDGAAGRKDVASPNGTDVDSKGAQEQFNLVFSIAKKK
nr:hypothetical protein [uncultured Romboutsia sp.]